MSRNILMGAAAIVTTTGFAFAGTGIPDVDISMDWNDGSSTTAYDLIKDSDEWYYEGNDLVMIGGDSSAAWTLDWEARTGAGTTRGGSEFVVANINVFNNTLSTQTYWVLETKNGISVGPNTITEGTVSATLFDLSGDGATMANISSGGQAGSPIYQSLIDNVAHQNMWTAGYSLTAAANGNNADDDVFDNVPGGGVVDSIGVWLRFEVTALDSVNVIGFFEVTPVPAPATLPVLAVLGLVGARRRRRA
jgi:hypothetical protein